MNLVDNPNYSECYEDLTLKEVVDLIKNNVRVFFELNLCRYIGHQSEIEIDGSLIVNEVDSEKFINAGKSNITPFNAMDEVTDFYYFPKGDSEKKFPYLVWN